MPSSCSILVKVVISVIKPYDVWCIPFSSFYIVYISHSGLEMEEMCDISKIIHSTVVWTIIATDASVMHTFCHNHLSEYLLCAFILEVL
jgi:hypothetical protein